MRRLLIYAILFPAMVWFFLCAVNRSNLLAAPWLATLASIAMTYGLCIAPALLTGMAHNALKQRGYRSILCLSVGVVTTPLMFMLFIDSDGEGVAYAVAGLVAAICCWWVSRIGQQHQPAASRPLAQ